jgi:hypothetical protein
MMDLRITSTHDLPDRYDPRDEYFIRNLLPDKFWQVLGREAIWLIASRVCSYSSFEEMVLRV